MRILICIAVVCFIWLVITDPPIAEGHPETRVRKLDVGPITVRVQEPKRIGLSEVLEVGVTLVAPKRVELRDPSVLELPVTCKNLGIRTEGPDIFEGPTSPLLSGPLIVCVWYLRFEPLRLGKIELGNLSFEYREGSEDWQDGKIPLPTVEVVAGPTSSADPSTLRPPPSLPIGPTKSRVPQILRWAGGVLLVVTLGIGAIFLMLKKPPVVSSTREALDELLRLEDSGLLDSGCFREFVEQICQVIREYLESAYILAAPRQSTPEFLRDPRTAEVLTDDQLTYLAEFLDSSDVEKFAAHEPNEELCRICLRRARTFLVGEPTL